MKYPGYIFRIKPKQPNFDDTLEKYEKLTASYPTKEIIEKRAIDKSIRDIFVVHGHDETLKIEVARFLKKLELNPIILHEQSNNGRTIIEKFEDHSKVGFAVILITGDDQGGKIGESTMLPRARQNVILEHGYFLGALGRKNVCALLAEGVEVPSDLSGVLYTQIDKKGAWKLELAKEIKASGIEVDLNLVV